MSVLNYKYGPWWADEDPFRSVSRKAKLREERDWKKRVQEELDEMAEPVNDDTIYIVVNEYVTEQYPDATIREDLYFYRTANGAWDELNSIARELGVEIEGDEESFLAPTDRTHLLEDYYYIEERYFND